MPATAARTTLATATPPKKKDPVDEYLKTTPAVNVPMLAKRSPIRDGHAELSRKLVSLRGTGQPLIKELYPYVDMDKVRKLVAANSAKGAIA